MSKRVLGVLGGADMEPELLRKWAESAQFLVAADSGANLLVEMGIRPEVILGDFDSISARAKACGAELIRLDEDQFTTDCDKLLAYAVDKSLLPLSLIGFEGDRLDQVLGALHSVARKDLGDQVRLVARKSLLWVLGPGEHSRNFAGKRTVSLIPLTACEGLRTEGLNWRPHSVLEPGGSTSISNLSETGSFSVSFDSGFLLLVVQISPEEMPVW